MSKIKDIHQLRLVMRYNDKTNMNVLAYQARDGREGGGRSGKNIEGVQAKIMYLSINNDKNKKYVRSTHV